MLTMAGKVVGGAVIAAASVFLAAATRGLMLGHMSSVAGGLLLGVLVGMLGVYVWTLGSAVARIERGLNLLPAKEGAREKGSDR